MVSTSSGKHKHKKEKRSRRRQTISPNSNDCRNVGIDLTSERDDSGDDVISSDCRNNRHNKHRKHREHHRELHHHKRYNRNEERESEIIAVSESDSDSSDCVEVPLEASSSYKSQNSDRVVPPPPPQLSKYAEYEIERLKLQRDINSKSTHDIYGKGNEHNRKHESRYISRTEDYHFDVKKHYENQTRIERSRNKRSLSRDRESNECDIRSEVSEQKDITRLKKKTATHSKNEISNKEYDKDRKFSPIPESGAGDCLSIEETNKLRLKLGLKPLEVETNSTSTSVATSINNSAAYKDEWGEFLHKPAENLKEKADAEKLKEKLKQRKEKRFLEERLALISTLGEPDDDIDDINKWIKRNKRIVDERLEAERRAKVLEEMDTEFSSNQNIIEQNTTEEKFEYNHNSLKGLKVDHNVNAFHEGKSIILTLKDAEVLDEVASDTLVNVNMLDDERYMKNVENKKKMTSNYGYDVYEEQYDELGNPMERSVLKKYDEEINREKSNMNTFIIGENLADEQKRKRMLLEIKTKLSGKKLETLNDVNTTMASDTFTEEELVKFKKPKKKVKKLRQKLKVEDLLPLVNENDRSKHLGTRSEHHLNTNELIDDKMSQREIDKETYIKLENVDNTLENVLAKACKLKKKELIIRKPLTIDPEDLKLEIKSENMEDILDDEVNRDGHIVLNATAEFCRTLGDIPTYGMAGNRDEESNELMDFEANDIIEERSQIIETQSNHGTWNTVDPDEVIQPADLDNIAKEEIEDVAILDEEPDVGAGVANALRLALSKGYLEKEEKNRPSNSKMAHLQAKNYSIEDKTTGDDDKFGRRDRFHSGPILEFKDKDNFKPNIKLEYIDDNGRILNLKEAFRYLSHKFHGKGPGKNKIEKRLKKMEQDGLMKTMSSTDTPLGTLGMLQLKQKETKAPYVLLSGSKQSTITAPNTSISKFR